MRESEIRWAGLVLVPTRSAMNEMYKHEMTLKDVKNILENGYDCSCEKRKRGTHEKCVNKGRKTVKVVVAKSYGMFSKRDEWAIIHVGTFTKRVNPPLSL